MVNTQTATFRAINTWLSNPDQSTARVFWLVGLSGTGKPTISRSLADSFFKTETDDSQTILGATFFFDNLDVSRSNTTALIPTIAKSLAKIRQLPKLGDCIAHAIQADDGIGSKVMRTCWDLLITGPLAKVDATIDRSVQILIVIDALDVCANRQGMDDFLSLLAHKTLRTLKHIRVVFFLCREG